MTHVRAPLSRYMNGSCDERLVQRGWRGIEEKRAKSRARSSRPAAWIAGSLSVAAAATLVFALHGSRAHEAGALRRADGSEPLALSAAAARQPVSVLFDDGSRVELSPLASASVIENTGHVFVLVLDGGRAAFDVRPGGPRRWSIECGLATVDVVGTRFSLDREEDSLTVAVTHGTVVVRGERVPEHVQRLGAGTTLVVRAGDAPVVPATLPTVAPLAATAGPSVAAPSASEQRAGVDSADVVAGHTSADAVAPRWTELARRGRYQQAYGTLGARGIASTAERATPRDLLALADVARLSGHPAEALLPLHRLISAYPLDPNVAIAYFTLGRIQLDSMSDASAAADAFGRAIRAGIPQTLADEAYARLVEARARSGDPTRARAAEEDYLRRFPAGRHVNEVMRWVSGR